MEKLAYGFYRIRFFAIAQVAIPITMSEGVEWIMDDYQGGQPQCALSEPAFLMDSNWNRYCRKSQVQQRWR